MVSFSQIHKPLLITKKLSLSRIFKIQRACLIKLIKPANFKPKMYKKPIVAITIIHAQKSVETFTMTYRMLQIPIFCHSKRIN